MRRLICLTACLFLLGSSSHLARAQEPGKIVDQYVKAAGGGRALSKIRTLALEGTFTTDDGKSGTYTLNTKLPNRYYLELLVGEQNLIEAYNGKSAKPKPLQRRPRIPEQATMVRRMVFFHFA